MRNVFSMVRVAWLCAALACGFIAGLCSAGVASEILASWVQAVFSVVAIFAASALWHADRSKQERERSIQAFALDLQAAVSQLEGLTNAQKFFSSLRMAGKAAEQTMRPDGRASFHPHVVPGVIDFALHLPNLTARCSPGVQADALAFAAWVVRYTKCLADCVVSIHDPVYGDVRYEVNMGMWPLADECITHVLETSGRLSAKLNRALSNPPGPRG